MKRSLQVFSRIGRLLSWLFLIPGTAMAHNAKPADPVQAVEPGASVAVAVIKCAKMTTAIVKPAHRAEMSTPWNSFGMPGRLAVVAKMNVPVSRAARKASIVAPAGKAIPKAAKLVSDGKVRRPQITAPAYRDYVRNTPATRTRNTSGAVLALSKALTAKSAHLAIAA